VVFIPWLRIQSLILGNSSTQPELISSPLQKLAKGTKDKGGIRRKEEEGRRTKKEKEGRRRTKKE
jgi:hypothetical protein